RALVFHHASPRRSGLQVLIQTRAGNLIQSGFPDIVVAVRDQIPVGTVLDGELVVWDGNGVNFTHLAGRLGSTRRAEQLAAERPASLLVFDILAANSVDIRHLPLHERQEVLTAVMAGTHPPIQQVPSTRDVNQARRWVADYAATP